MLSTFPEKGGGMDLTSIFRLDGKVAIVTGAWYGLGVLFADVLASAGADVVVTARSKEKPTDERARRIVGPPMLVARRRRHLIR